MPKLYVLVGIPGSGKSTWVSNQEWATECAYISTDKHVEKYAQLQNKTYSEVFEEYMPEAVRLMSEEVVKAREKNQDIIWDQTSTTISSRKKKFLMLPNYYSIAVIFKTPPEQELKKRLKSRPGKIIPKRVVTQMIEGFEQPTEEEGFKEIWFVN